MSIEGLGFDLIKFIAFLFPGFAGVIAFKALSETKKLEKLEMTIYAIFLTFASNYLSNILFETPLIFPDMENLREIDTTTVNLTFQSTISATVISVIAAVAVALLHTHGLVYKFLGFVKLTRKTGRISIWHDVFSEFRGAWVEIIFTNEKRIIGWPQYYSITEGQFELFLADAIWLVPIVDSENISNEHDEESLSPDRSNQWIRSEVLGPGVYVNNPDNILAINILTGGNPSERQKEDTVT